MFEVIGIVEAAALSFRNWNGWGGTKTLHSLERMSGCFCRIREMLRRATYCTSGAEEIIVTIISEGEWRGIVPNGGPIFLMRDFCMSGLTLLRFNMTTLTAAITTLAF